MFVAPRLPVLTLMATSSSVNRLIVEDSAPIRAGWSELRSEIAGVSVVESKRAVRRQPRALGKRTEPSQVLSLTDKTVGPTAPRAFPSPDPEFAPPVTASAEEIRYAQELRRQIVQQYLNRPSPPVSFWCVGVD